MNSDDEIQKASYYQQEINRLKQELNEIELPSANYDLLASVMDDLLSSVKSDEINFEIYHDNDDYGKDKILVTHSNFHTEIGHIETQSGYIFFHHNYLLYQELKKHLVTPLIEDNKEDFLKKLIASLVTLPVNHPPY